MTRAVFVVLAAWLLTGCGRECLRSHEETAPSYIVFFGFYAVPWKASTYTVCDVYAPPEPRP